MGIGMKGEHITDVLDNAALATLSPRELEEIRAHAQNCMTCGNALAAAQVSAMMIKERAQVAIEPSPFFQTRVLAAWREDRLTHHGRCWSYDGVEVLPKPLQTPHPPVWLAATSQDSIRRAAEGGYDILQDPHSTNAEIGKKRAFYHETLRAHGFPTEGRVIPTARLLAVGATDREGEELARTGAEWTVASYANDVTRATPAPYRVEGLDPVERYMDDVIIHGSPERVIDKLAELRETIGLDYLMCAPLSHQTFMRFTDKVLPKLM